MDNYNELFKRYNCDLDDAQVQKEVTNIRSKHFAENCTVDVFKECLNCIDLTSLNGSDTDDHIISMVQKVNKFHETYPDIPNVGAICVYPAMVPVVKGTLTEKVGIASAAAGFPASQTFIEVKVAEVAMAVMEGATEIDVVLSIGKFLSGDFEIVREELTEIKSACRKAHLKVIIESGALGSAANIKKASILAMSAGADFIKTSTGKIPVAATPEVSYIMCQAIKEWYKKTGEKVGYKPAGGIVTAEEAVLHYTIVKEVLGKEWLNNQFFRIGASRLANNLLSSIKGREIEYF